MRVEAVEMEDEARMGSSESTIGGMEVEMGGSSGCGGLVVSAMAEVLLGGITGASVPSGEGRDTEQREQVRMRSGRVGGV